MNKLQKPKPISLNATSSISTEDIQVNLYF